MQRLPNAGDLYCEPLVRVVDDIITPAGPEGLAGIEDAPLS
jgi:hypothetical protein